MQRIVTTSVIALAVFGISAHAQPPPTNSGAERQAWVCTYPGASADHRPVIVRFHVEGEDLIEEFSVFKVPHRILQNTPFAIVAAWAIAEVEPNHTTPSIGAFVVIIDKKTLVFRRSNVMLDEPGEATSYGSCIKD